jgi:hypothetical protein
LFGELEKNVFFSENDLFDFANAECFEPPDALLDNRLRSRGARGHGDHMDAQEPLGLDFVFPIDEKGDSPSLCHFPETVGIGASGISHYKDKVGILSNVAKSHLPIRRRIANGRAGNGFDLRKACKESRCDLFDIV